MTNPSVDEAGSPSRLGRFRLILWLLVALAGVAGVMLALSAERKEAPVPSYADTVGGPFELVTPDGAVFTDAQLAGRPYAIFFGFTRCPDVCPTTLARLARLRGELGSDGDKFEIVFVSVDPGYDNPADIGNYVELFGTPIIGLTGSQPQLDRIVKAYHVYYEKVPLEGGDYTIDHTAGVFLMDRDGRLQSIIDHKESDQVALDKLRRLVG